VRPRKQPRPSRRIDASSGDSALARRTGGHDHGTMKFVGLASAVSLRQAAFIGLIAPLLLSACGPAALPQPAAFPAATGGVAPSVASERHDSPAPKLLTPLGTLTPAANPTLPVQPTPAPQLHVGGSAWVAVTVVTGWRSPDAPRAVDAPALADPVRLRAWLAGLTIDLQAGLIGRIDTQVLLGERVVITALVGAWAHVVVPDQPTPLDERGYPAWVPLGQLTALAPAAPRAAPVATIITPSAWLEDASGTRIEEASFGTRLPELATSGGRVQVALPARRTAWLDSASVVVRPTDQPALPATADAVIASARQFLGLRYLWGGTSGFGYDCSGLVYLIYRVHGINLPRDGLPQSGVGTAVVPASLRPGDLVFFARDGSVHHVAIWMGAGTILEAPDIGMPVRLAALASLSYASELSIARRVLD
jgi:gamma-D-glutamyl-L-lysine dipeptidyl-peptidase